MADIKAGSYSVAELLRAADFDLSRAGADYLNGNPDLRRVTVGGLGFDSLEDRLSVPVTADAVDITLDGEVVESLSVKLSDAQKAERAYSFETAADADDSGSSPRLRQSRRSESDNEE